MEDRKLFVGGLSWDTGETDIMDYFGRFGPVESVALKTDPNTGKSRCFAFVVFKDPADLTKAFAQGEHAILSKKVDVKRARAKPGKIFVGGLKAEMTDDDIREYFGQFGTIIEFEMPFDKIKKQRKGFGFITFEREETMKELIKRGKVTIGPHQVDLRRAAPKQDFNMMGGPMMGGPMGGGGGYGGGGYGGGPMMDYYGGGGYGDYYGGGGGGGGYGDYYGGGGGGGGWGAYGGGYGAGAGGKMRGGKRGGGGEKPTPY